MKRLTTSRFTHQTPLKGSGGFTIIETLLFLAISMLLVLLIAVGQGAVTARARYRDAVESLESKLVQVQEELRSTINGNATGTSGTNVNEIILGKVVVFTYNHEEAQVYQCLASRTDGPLSPGVLSCDMVNAVETIPIRWGVVPVALNTIKSGANAASEGVDTILFYRHHLTGDVRTVGYDREALGVSPLVAVQNMLTSSYGGASAAYRELALHQPSRNYRAVIRVNYATGVSLGANTTALNQIDKQYLD